MRILKVMTIVALVWGNSAFAASSIRNVPGGDVQTRISLLMEHFEHKHPELAVRIRTKYASYPINNYVARQVLNDLTRLDIIEEQHQQDPAGDRLETLVCKRALCFSVEEDEAEESQFRPGHFMEVKCKKPAC